MANEPPIDRVLPIGSKRENLRESNRVEQPSFSGEISHLIRAKWHTMHKYEVPEIKKLEVTKNRGLPLISGLSFDPTKYIDEEATAVLQGSATELISFMLYFA